MGYVAQMLVLLVRLRPGCGGGEGHNAYRRRGVSGVST